jgi:alkylated DNA repair dioxygenase AlkB
MSYKIFKIATYFDPIEELKALPFHYTYHLDQDNVLMRSPRKMCWFAENATWYYQFSRSHIKPLWPYTFAEYPIVQQIKKQIEKLTKCTFNCCLINIYNNGNEYADWHDDNEPWLGKDPIIASVSYGESRNFEIRHKVTQEITYITLHNNDLLLMESKFQDTFQHRLPQDDTSKMRINLTFRKIIPELIEYQYGDSLKPY